MKNNKLSFVLISFIILFTSSSCQKSIFHLDGETDYLIFGSSYGMCQGDCSNSYLLKSDGVYKSKTYIRNGDKNSFTEKLSNDKFQQIKSISNSIPAELINYKKNEESFGCPDCADQGALYLELVRSSKVPKVFRIDTNTGDLPEYLQKTALDIKEAIKIAQN